MITFLEKQRPGAMDFFLTMAISAIAGLIAALIVPPNASVEKLDSVMFLLAAIMLLGLTAIALVLDKEMLGPIRVKVGLWGIFALFFLTLSLV